MFRSRLRTIVSLFAVLVMFGATALAPAVAKPGDNGGPGNSGAAKQCQKEGWMALARTEAPTVGFANQDECVSYGAEGGILVDLIPYNPIITASFAPTSNPSYCEVSYHLTGFMPDTQYTVGVETREGGVFTDYGTVVADTDDAGSVSGVWSVYVESEDAALGDSFVNFSVASAGVESGFVEIDCTD